MLVFREKLVFLHMFDYVVSNKSFLNIANNWYKAEWSVVACFREVPVSPWVGFPHVVTYGRFCSMVQKFLQLAPLVSVNVYYLVLEIYWAWVYWVFTQGQFWHSGIVVACVCVCVCLSVCQSLACPRDNSGPVQARITKFGPKMQKTLV